MKGAQIKPALFFAFVFFLFTYQNTLRASDKTDFVNQLCKQFVSPELPSHAESFIELLTKNFDIDFFSTRVMKDISSRLKEDDKKELTQLLLQKLQNKTRQKVADWDAKSLSDFVIIQKDENCVLVKFKNGNKNVNLDIYLSLTSAELKIGDLAVDGALFSRSLRSQFSRIFNEEGIDGLKKRLQQNSAQNIGK